MVLLRVAASKSAPLSDLGRRLINHRASAGTRGSPGFPALLGRAYAFDEGNFPPARVPYAYFLVGLTMIPVATYGVTAPAQVWQIGLNRTLEILVGAISSLLLTTVVWPRYAREEFLEAGRAALKTASQLVSMDTEAYLHGTEAQVERIHQAFNSVMTGNLTNAVLSVVDTISRKQPLLAGDAERLRGSLHLLIGFFGGCVVAAAAVSSLGDWAWLFPVVLAGVAVASVPRAAMITSQ